MSDGDPLVITDMLTDTRLTATDRDNFDALDFRSSVFVPLVKDGQLVAVFSVGQSTPREWTDTEIAMVEETAERTWAAVERANAEQALRESEERYRTLFESIDEGYCIIEVLFDEDEDPVDYRFLETNPVFEEQTGLVDAKGKLMRELEPHHEEHWFETYGRIALTGEPERFTNEAKYLDERWYDVYAFRIGEPEKRKVAILFNDISDRKHTQRSLERLNDASRELMTADTQEITERAAAITQRVLGLDYTALWEYNERTGELQLATTVTSRKIDDETIRYPDGFSEQVWQTFISDDVEICTDLSPIPENLMSESPVRSNVLIPLSRKGVIYAGSMDPETFDETTVDLARTLAATLETALERAEGEQQLAQQNRDLAYLDQLYSLMWKIDQKLVQAGTVESIDRAVCEQLADSDLFEFAWIGEFDAIRNTITPRQWAGIDSSYLDDRTITIDANATNQDPVADAVSTQDSQIVADVATDKRLAAFRETILARGARSCISVPLIFEDTLYGVLTVFAAQLQPHERNQRVLDELGRTIAHAINAAQKEETVRTDNVVELTIQFQEPGTVLARLARNADVKFQFKGIVPDGNDSSHVFFTGSRTSADEIHAAGRNLAAITRITRVAENDETCMFRATVSGSTLASQLATQKGAMRTLTFDRNAAIAIVDLPSTADVRPFVDELQRTYSSVKIMSHRSRDRLPESVQDVQMAIREPLTERQADVLKLAYLSGFFESPRESTGQEIADLLDVSAPTFTQHLRAAERKVFALAFDEE
nr:GAF domain-containing protein [Haladaptatus sp. W1]